MKKLLAVVAVCAALVGSVFAKENLIEVGAGYKFLMGGSSSGGIFGLDLHTQSMSTETLGMGSSFEFGFIGGGAYEMDFTAGVAIRPVNTDKFALFVTPGVAVEMVMAKYEDYLFMVMDLGISAQVAASYKLTDNIYLTGNLDSAYYFYAYVVGLGSGSANAFALNPQLGVTFKF